MITEEFDVKVKRFEATDPRLGRHVVHDSRSLAFRAEEADPATLVSKRHQVLIPVLDQGNYFDPTLRKRISLGSCTGNAGTENLATEKFWESVDQLLSKTDTDWNEEFAVNLYGDATAIDPWPGQWKPDDTGSNGLSIAKVLHKREIISGYQHATSLLAVLTALQKQAVIVGTEWRNDMFDPDPDGRLRITGAVAGGHEYLLDEIDVQNKRVWMLNSWGKDWGINGRAWMSWADFETLLLADGDCTVFVPNFLPSPEPTPQPAPTPPVNDAADQIFAKAAHKWLNGFPFFYKGFQRSLKDWLQDRNF